MEKNKLYSILIWLVPLLLLFSIIEGILCVNLFIKNRNIKSFYIDEVPAIEYYENAKEFYERSKWNDVIINASKYEKKLVSVFEPINSNIYLFSSYSYYKLFKSDENSWPTNYLNMGINEIDKFLKANKTNATAYFIKGLLCIEYTNSMNKLNSAKSFLSKALKYSSNNPILKAKIENHIKIADERIEEIKNRNESGRKRTPPRVAQGEQKK